VQKSGPPGRFLRVPGPTRRTAPFHDPGDQLPRVAPFGPNTETQTHFGEPGVGTSSEGGQAILACLGGFLPIFLTDRSRRAQPVIHVGLT
jgi:hypothetical protein